MKIMVVNGDEDDVYHGAVESPVTVKFSSQLRLPIIPTTLMMIMGVISICL